MKLFTLIFRSVTSIELLRTSYLTENTPSLKAQNSESCTG